MMASNVISQPLGVITHFSVIAKIHKYRGLYEGHHFVSMVMEMHSAPGCDEIISLGNVCLFMINNQEVIYPCLFTFNFSSIVLILFFNVL
jgi:hypothetical protein